MIFEPIMNAIKYIVYGVAFCVGYMQGIIRGIFKGIKTIFKKESEYDSFSFA